MTKNRIHRAHHPLVHGSSARESFHRDPRSRWSPGETQMAGGRNDLGRKDHQRLGLSSAKHGDITIIIYNQLLYIYNYIYICSRCIIITYN